MIALRPLCSRRRSSACITSRSSQRLTLACNSACITRATPATRSPWPATSARHTPGDDAGVAHRAVVHVAARRAVAGIRIQHPLEAGQIDGRPDRFVASPNLAANESDRRLWLWHPLPDVRIPNDSLLAGGRSRRRGCRPLRSDRRRPDAAGVDASRPAVGPAVVRAAGDPGSDPGRPQADARAARHHRDPPRRRRPQSAVAQPSPTTTSRRWRPTRRCPRSW